MATNSDAEKLRKQIDVLSSLIHTQRELKKKDDITNKQRSSVQYSWKKGSFDSDIKSISRNQLSHERRQSKQYSIKPSTSLTLDRRKNENYGQFIVRKSSVKTIPQNQSTAIYSKNLYLKSTGKANIELSKPSEFTKQIPSKPVLISDSKDTDHSRMIDKNDCKAQGVKNSVSSNVGPQKAVAVKNVSVSASLLGARLSSLTSSIAAAKSKLNLESVPGNVSSKEVTKLSTTPSSSLMTESSSLPLSSSSNDKTKEPSSSSSHPSYSWSKSSQPSTSNLKPKSCSFKLEKASTSSLKWTNPSINKDQSVLKKSSNKPLSSRSLLVKPSHGNTHVWRSPQSLILDRRKRNSISKDGQQPGRPLKGFMKRRQKTVLKDTSKKAIISKYSLVINKRKRAIKAENSSKFVIIEGVPYKSSANKLQKINQEKTATSSKKVKKRSSVTLNIRGEKFLMDTSGKTLTRIEPGKAPPGSKETDTLSKVSSRRSLNTKGTKGKHPKRRSSLNKISIGGVVFVQTAPGVLVRSNEAANKKIARRVVRRSVQNAILYKYKKNVKAKPKSEQYCMFYNRFGKCNKGENCPYIHDPTKIAICTKFLQGKCKKTDGSCSFSHKIDKDKMPVCQFFLKGNCTNDNCPYSHVNVSSKAAVCQDFIKGYCLNGQQCKKKHILDCEEFSQTGKCSKGKKCNMIHRERKPKKRKRISSASKETKPKRAALEQMTEDDGFLPLEQMDDNDSSLSENLSQKPKEPIAIKPRFLINQGKEG